MREYSFSLFIEPLPKNNIFTTFLTIFAIIFGLTIMANAAVKPDLMSKAPNGANGNGNSRVYAVSADGRYIVFESAATNLIGGLTDTNNTSDIFLRDTQTGTLRCISLATPTTTGNNFSFNPIISADGHYVVFASGATNLVSVTDTNSELDVFRYNTQTNQTQLVSVNVLGTSTGNGFSGNTLGGWHTYDMSDDGRYVAFMSNAFDLTLINDTNSKSDIFIRDMQLDGTRLASINANGTGTGNNESVDPSITADGQTVAFTSLSSNLVSVDANGQYDVFYYNYQTQITKCASLAISGFNGTGTFSSGPAVISKNGNRIAYYSTAHDLSNISIPFNHGFNHLYVHDIGFGLNFLVSVNTAGSAAGNNEVGIGNRQNINLSISANGRYVTFESRATNLAPNTSSAYNVFRRDLTEGKTELVTINPAGTQSGTQNSFVGLRGNGMSRDGRFITFYGIASNLVTDFPTGGGFQVYVRDMVNKITTALTLNDAGTALGNSDSDSSLISANGKAVIFESFASNLTPTHPNSFLDVYKAAVPTPQRPAADFDGDGLSDYAVFRPQTNGVWYVLNNSATNASYRYYGAGSDLLAPADYNGDGRTDYAVFRSSNGTWYISDSLSFSETTVNFGLSGDKPLPEDFDGDGKADLAVYRNGTWWWQSSQTGQAVSYQFGLAGDIPVQGDFDGDGRADYAVFRPSNGTWYVRKSSDGGVLIVNFGLSGDKPVANDFDGDGKTDIAIFRAGTWYILKTRDGSVTITQFGLATDIPAVGNYDGDGRSDIVVFRPSDGNWYVLRSSDGEFAAVHFGQNADKPVPAAFIP